jgi:tRNA pseudouridine13 synthase
MNYMKLKTVPEDFKVKELMNLDLSEGEYSYFLLKKKGWNTIDVVRIIAQNIGVNERDIGVAGFKDKEAVTEQVISIWRANLNHVKALKLHDITLEYLGKGPRRINLGELKGNLFEIVVKDVEKKELVNKEVLNLFDEQRFGIDGKNKTIGKALLKKDLKNVVELLGYEIKDNQYVNFLRTLSRRILRFYLSAYQSFLWNEVVKSLDKKHEEVPIYGFLTKFDDSLIEEKYNRLLEKEDVKRADFLMKFFPELASEGGSRKMFMKAENFKQEWKRNGDEWEAKLNFFLPKGCYATMFVKEIFK